MDLSAGPEYDRRRKVWNAAVDRRPGAIVVARGAADVAAALRRYAGRPVTVRGGGHSAVGLAVADGAAMIDLSELRAVSVDAERRLVTVGGGALWQDVDRETAPHDLYVPAGLISHTGVGGLTLGGGIGWLSRRFGLASDHLVGATLVTPAGDTLAVDAERRPELLWGLQGGCGGNFGVVTSFTFACEHVASPPYVGRFRFPLRALRDVLALLVELDASRPASQTFYPFVDVDGVLLVAVDFADAEGTGEAFDDIMRLGPEYGDGEHRTVQEMNAMFDDGNGHGRHYRWSRSTFLPGFEPAALAALITDWLGRLPAGQAATVELMHLGGAMRSGPGAFAQRSFAFEIHAIVVGAGTDPLAPAAEEWVRGVGAAFSDLLGGSNYLNVDGLASASRTDRVRAALGDSFERLQRLKDVYDPTNQLRHNHNIPPSSGAGAELDPLPIPPVPVATVTAVHKGIGCDGCGAMPVRGVRFRCAVCPDYDLCAACEGSGRHEHHPMLKLRRPRHVPRRALLSAPAPDPLPPTGFFADVLSALSRGISRLRHVPPEEIRDQSGAAPEIFSDRGTRLTGATLSDTVEAAFLEYGPAPFLDGLSYDDVYARAKPLAAALAQRTLSGAVGILGGVALEWVLTDFACALAGLPSVALPTPTAQSPTLLAQCLRATGVKTLVCCPSMAPTVPGVTVIPWDALPAADPDALQRRHADTFTFMFSSGSTGLPKPIRRSTASWHAFLAAFASANADRVRPLVTVAHAPLFHISERGALWASFVQGGHITLFPGGPGLFEAFKRARPTVVAAVPAVWNALYEMGPEAAAAQLGDRVQVVVTGGAPTHPHVLAFLREAFPVVADAYGSTECGSVLVDGRPVPGVELRIEPVPELGYSGDSEGELLVRTGTMASDLAVDRDGWFHTGDIVRILPDDRVEIIDRRAFVIKLAQGEFVAPEAVEAVLGRSALVRDVFVTGHPSQSRLSAVAATEASADDVRASFAALAAEAGLRSYEVPAAVVCVRGGGALVGATASGKKDRRAMARHYRAQLNEAYEAVEDMTTRVAALLGGSGGGGAGGEDGWSFAAAGGDSAAALRFIGQVRDATGVDVPAELLFRATSVKEIADFIRSAGAGAGAGAGASAGGTATDAELAAADLDRAAALAQELPDPGVDGDRSVCLLTGATGHLGSFLLPLLTERFDRVVCLVRASSAAVPCPGAETVVGDLARPRLGLPEQTWAALARSVGVVVHCGAWVNWLADYASARAANVGATLEVARLCRTSTRKTLHFVSTLSAVRPGEAELSRAYLDELLRERAGYGASKWVAEWAARHAGVPVTVSRPGLLCGSAETGASNARDFPSRLLATVAALGAGVGSEAAAMRALPVDVAARRVVARLLEDGAVFHVAAGDAVSHAAVCEAVEAGTGRPIRRLASVREFAALLTPDVPLHGLQRFVTEEPVGPDDAQGEGGVTVEQLARMAATLN